MSVITYSKSNMCGVIYLTYDTVCDKYYIGKDTHNNPKYFGSGVKIRDIARQRPETLTKTILQYENSFDRLSRLEQIFIDSFRATINPKFYNITCGAGGHSGRTRDSGASPRQVEAWTKSKGRKIKSRPKRTKGKCKWLYINGVRKYVDTSLEIVPTVAAKWVTINGRRQWIPADMYDPNIHTERRESGLRGRPSKTRKCMYFKFQYLDKVFEFRTEKDFVSNMNLPASIAQKLKRYGIVHIAPRHKHYAPGTVFNLISKTTRIEPNLTNQLRN